MATPTSVIVPIHHVGLSGGYGCSAERLRAAPEMCEIRSAGCVGGKPNAEQRERGERADFRYRENILDDRAKPKAARIDPGDEHDRKNGEKILAVEANVVGAEVAKPQLPGAESAELQNPFRGGEPRNHHRREFRECDCHGCDRGRLDHKQHRPAVEETPDRAQRFAQVDVLPAGLRHRGGEFSVAERADQRHYAGSEPYGEQKRRALYLMRDIRGHDEDARADHRPETIIVASKRPRPLTSSDFSAAVAAAARIVCACSAIPSRGPFFACLYVRPERTRSAIARYSRARRAGSGADSRSLTTATESAPALKTDSADCTVMPPIATRGFRVIRLAARRNSIPTTGSGFAFVDVGKMGPTAI